MTTLLPDVPVKAGPVELYMAQIDKWRGKVETHEWAAVDYEQARADLLDALLCSGDAPSTMRALRYTLAKYGEYVNA